MSIYMKIILILTPLVVGLITYQLIYISPVILQILMGIFWLWVGYKFSITPGNSIMNFLVGNSLWLIAFLFFILQFVLTTAVLNFFIGKLTVSYMFTFKWLGEKVHLPITHYHPGVELMFSAFIMMLVVFTAGFIFGKSQERFSTNRVFSK
ncbi:hypothetical protein E3U55_10405 [Filobacillus milosensis]|uniref:Uncharacterized protein n=1 Tax=Filobacillus milosensis TaxID=94137 RepID=A0A4Y8IJU4_9BACI|nr:hypothetical protein [Filobacillus milosensis]TFB19564.1 hypothetical protein E3U55_10405 [Filobacillus milosensis]